MTPLVLIVDDNPTNSYLLAYFAGRLGLRVQTAADGAQALALAAAEPPALVLLDLHMPGMDGFETAARLRALPGLDTVPVIAVTANVSPVVRSRLERAGFADCITKPVDTEAFPAILRRHLPPFAP